MKPKARLWGAELARSPSAWLTPRSTRSIRRPALPAAPAPTDTARCARAAGARCASSSGPFASASALRSSTTSAKGCISPQAMADPPAFGRARAVARFEDGPARTLVHRLKYSDRAELARPIASWMARAGADILADADLLTPVPLHALRLWRRQFNQAAALAGEISRRTGKPSDLNALRRIKATRSQVGLSRAQRAENVQGAFRMRRRRGGAGAQCRSGRRRVNLGGDR